MTPPIEDVLPAGLLEDTETLQLVQQHVHDFVERCISRVMNEEGTEKVTRLVLGRNLVGVLIPDYLDDLARWNKHPVRQVGVYPNGAELFVSRKDNFVNAFYQTEDGSTTREFTAPDDLFEPAEEDVIVEALLDE